MFHHVALCLALLAAPALAQGTPELLPETEQTGWNAVGRVNLAGLKQRRMCTGTLVAADLVLTAAHCVYRNGRIALTGDLHFVAGWRGGDYAAHSVAAEIFVDPGWSPQNGTAAHDIAFLRLATPIPAGIVPLPLATLPDPVSSLTLIGYRRDRPHALTRQDPCMVTYRDDTRIGLDCAVIPGASGGPVLWRSPDGWRVVALVSASVDGSGPTRSLAPLISGAGPAKD